jgi:sugar phosphate permease
MAACFAICGLFQGPLVPGQGVMKYPWLPKGVAKAWALRIISLGTRIGRLVAAAATPWLCSKFGWQFVPYLYGGATAAFGVLFQLLATNKPPPSEIGEKEAEKEQAAAATPAKPKEQKAVDYGIARIRTIRHQLTVWIFLTECLSSQLSVPAAQSVILAHIGDNNSEYTLSQWAPTFMLTVLNVPPAQLGLYLGPAQVVGLVGGWVVAALESVVRLQFNMTELGVRRWFTLIGSAIETAAIAGFGLSKTPSAASLMCESSNQRVSGGRFIRVA